MVSHICLLVELGPICNSTAASLCLKSCVDHSLLKSYNGGPWKNIYRSGPLIAAYAIKRTVDMVLDTGNAAIRTQRVSLPCLGQYHGLI